MFRRNAVLYVSVITCIKFIVKKLTRNRLLLKINDKY